MDSIDSKIKKMLNMALDFPISPNDVVREAQEICDDYPYSVEAKEILCFALCFTGHIEYISYNKVSGQDFIKRGAILLDELFGYISKSELLKVVANECYMDVGEIFFVEKKYEDSICYLNKVTGDLLQEVIWMKGCIYEIRLDLLDEPLSSFIEKLENVAKTDTLADGKISDVYRSLSVLSRINGENDERIHTYLEKHKYYEEKMGFLVMMGFRSENLDNYVKRVKRVCS